MNRDRQFYIDALRRAREDREARKQAQPALTEVAVCYDSPEDFMAEVVKESSVRE